MQKNSRGEQEASIAVSDTFPLIALMHAGLLGKLGRLFRGIVVPPNVMSKA